MKRSMSGTANKEPVSLFHQPEWFLSLRPTCDTINKMAKQTRFLGSLVNRHLYKWQSWHIAYWHTAGFRAGVVWTWGSLEKRRYTVISSLRISFMNAVSSWMNVLKDGSNTWETRMWTLYCKRRAWGKVLTCLLVSRRQDEWSARGTWPLQEVSVGKGGSVIRRASKLGWEG